MERKFNVRFYDLIFFLFYFAPCEISLPLSSILFPTVTRSAEATPGYNPFVPEDSVADESVVLKNLPFETSISHILTELVRKTWNKWVIPRLFLFEILTQYLSYLFVEHNSMRSSFRCVPPYFCGWNFFWLGCPSLCNTRGLQIAIMNSCWKLLSSETQFLVKVAFAHT